jgi:hypothetical protein
MSNSLDIRFLLNLNFSPKNWGYEKFNEVEEVKKMKYLRRLNMNEIMKKAKEDGIIVGEVVMDEVRLIKLCKYCGFDPKDFVF